jgi:hypothetical protein
VQEIIGAPLNMEFVTVRAYRQQVAIMCEALSLAWRKFMRGKTVSKERRHLLGDLLSALGWSGRMTKQATKHPQYWQGYLDFAELCVVPNPLRPAKKVRQEKEEDQGEEDELEQGREEHGEQVEEEQGRDGEERTFESFEHVVKTSVSKLGRWQASFAQGGRTKGFDSCEDLYEFCKEKLNGSQRWDDVFAVHKK